MNQANMSETPDILIVEDSPADRLLILEGLKDSKLPRRLHAVEDGEEALNFLKSCSSAQDFPNLIILDLNLPKKSGYEVLQEVKSDATLRSIPIIILTSSIATKDINYCYNAGANCYIVKGFGLDNFILAIKNIEHFWLSVVQLPKSHRKEIIAN